MVDLSLAQLIGVGSVLFAAFTLLHDSCLKTQKWYQKKFKTFMKLNKDIRYILTDHYGFSRSILYPSPWNRCKACPTIPATKYCPECKKQYCPACNARQHHPGTFATAHSVEDIIYDKKSKGIHIVTPILDYIVLFVIVQYVVTHVSIGPDYLHTVNTCPSLEYVQSWMAYVDSSLFYYYKSSLAFYCSVEDSFWKLILDLWVRTLLMESDTLLLLLTTLPQALIFQVAVLAFVVPGIALIYALVKAVCYSLELRLALLPENVKEGLRKVESFESTLCIVLEWCDVFSWLPPFNWLQDYFYNSDVDNLPSRQTKWRNRPTGDFLEMYKYAIGRSTRIFSYYKAHASDRLSYLVMVLTTLVVGIRVLCIFFPIAAQIIRGLVSLFVPSAVVATQQTWFQKSTMVDADDLLWRGLQSVVNRAEGFLPNLPQPGFWVLAGLLVVPGIAVMPGVGKLAKTKAVGFPKIAYQSQSFERRAIAGLLVLATGLVKVQLSIFGAVAAYIALYLGSIVVIHLQRKKFYDIWEAKDNPKSMWAVCGDSDLRKLSEQTLLAISHIDEYGKDWQELTEDR